MPGCKGENANIEEALQHFLRSPSYTQGDDDLDFLHREDLCGLRLNLDYLKPETLLESHGIAHTVIVFGSTRITETALARRR